MGTSARNLNFQLDNSAGSLQDLSARTSEVDFTPEAGMDDTTVFGASTDSKSFTVTLKDGKITVKGPWDATLSAHYFGILALTATTTFIIGPQGTTAGQEKYTGECRLKTFKTTGKVDGVLQYQADLQADGTVTRTTF